MPRSTARTIIKCPTCGREVAWESAPFKPFCSERCRLIDLGAWLSEQRAIPGEAPAQADETSDNPTRKG
jgi:endogenous inhibitor of DNA gyrase (YacG/DUF329 family)